MHRPTYNKNLSGHSGLLDQGYCAKISEDFQVHHTSENSHNIDFSETNHRWILEYTPPSLIPVRFSSLIGAASLLIWKQQVKIPQKVVMCKACISRYKQQVKQVHAPARLTRKNFSTTGTHPTATSVRIRLTSNQMVLLNTNSSIYHRHCPWQDQEGIVWLCLKRLITYCVTIKTWPQDAK